MPEEFGAMFIEFSVIFLYVMGIQFTASPQTTPNTSNATLLYTPPVSTTTGASLTTEVLEVETMLMTISTTSTDTTSNDTLTLTSSSMENEIDVYFTETTTPGTTGDRLTIIAQVGIDSVIIYCHLLHSIIVKTTTLYSYIEYEFKQEI